MSDPTPAPGITWAQFIRTARLSRGWSIDELAKRSDVSRMTIIRWEGGATRFRPDTIERVAAVLEVPQDVAMRAAFGAGEQDLPAPLPRQLSQLVHLYNELDDPSEREQLLERVGWIVEWAQMRRKLAGGG